jgi:hypothetical protein
MNLITPYWKMLQTLIGNQPGYIIRFVNPEFVEKMAGLKKKLRYKAPYPWWPEEQKSN